MERFFNTAGPMIPERNYYIDPLTRVDWDDVQGMIRDKRYFSLHAPRQTGKTSTLLAMMQVLDAEGSYACAYANIEAAQAARGDVTQGMPIVCGEVSRSLARHLRRPELESWNLQENMKYDPLLQFSNLLQHWATTSDKPTVLFLDEVDALVGETLISLLRQIRTGYTDRPKAFPQSIILCGTSDVRDYRMHQGGDEIHPGGSVFNIKAASLRMANFSQEEIKALWLQHTEETGQTFDDAIFPELWEDTRGQPGLVNALGHQITWKLRANRDRSRAITLSDYKEARKDLIQSRATPLDQLIDKLQEPSVHSAISSRLFSHEDVLNIPYADIEYVEDIGLIQRKPSIRISNRIYMDVIPHELTRSMQAPFAAQEQSWYVTPEHHLDAPKLLATFQQLFREHADTWIEGSRYPEARPQLFLQAFLQRIVNGKGRITWEYSLGRKRTDLLIEWSLDEALGIHGPLQRIAIEIKVFRITPLETVMDNGLEQTADYARRVGADEAHLIIFDRNPDRTWSDKIWRRDESFNGLPVSVWGA